MIPAQRFVTVQKATSITFESLDNDGTYVSLGVLVFCLHVGGGHLAGKDSHLLVASIIPVVFAPSSEYIRVVHVVYVDRFV